ncbi:MAG: UvrD-helicase domain-containing protein [Spirochaetales bacterium]|nr:UvrD-helicase domain-containing protein [Spirochaetales bacterium]
MTFEQIMHSEGFTPNAEQRPIIESVRNTVVSAGAGAGKTAVLSWRFLRLVMNEHVRPDQILTLTFTKKAANEMRQRIYQRLLKAKDSIPSDSLDSFRNANISTLDSFCSQIVRSDSITYGFSRDWTNLSDEDLEILSERLARTFLTDEQNSEEVRLLSTLDMPPSVLARFFKKIARLVSVAGDYDADRVSSAFLSSVREIYRKKRDELGSLLQTLGQYNLKGAFLAKYDNIMKCYEEESFGPDDYLGLQGVKDEEIKDLVNNEIKPILSKDSGFYILQDIANGPDQTPVLQKAVQKFATLINNEKRRMGALTFKDVSELAVTALRDNIQLRNTYKNRYRFIMIDEFQDNNSIQRDLLFLLSEKTSLEGEKGRIPKLEELEQSKLFFVGDEKQSIYSFRGADVSVFRRLQQDIGRNGDSLSLGTNYRSQKKLIGHFNDVFSKILCDSEKDFEARYTPIDCGRESDGTDSKIIFSVYNKSDIEDDDMDSGILEAEAVGDYCKRILETDEFLVAGQRPKPEDIAIIFRSSTNQMNIEKALKRRNIPYQIAETRSLMLDAVSSDFYSLLNILIYPEDRRSLAAVLKSPFCGLCDRSIHNVMTEDSAVLPVDSKRYELFLSFLEELKKNAFRMTIAQVLQFIYINGGYSAYLKSNEDRCTFQEHYEYLFSYAVDFDSSSKTLNDYVKFLRDNMGTASKLTETTVLHSSKSGVQIMTVHKSKGLEFKVVIFAGIGGKGQSDKADFVFEYGGNLVASENKFLQKILDEDRKERDKAELKRIMYVAMTRAKDHLILIGSYTRKDDNYSMADVMQWYSDAIGMDYPNLKCQNPDVIVEDVSDTSRVAGSQSNATMQIAIPSDFKEFNTKENHISVTELEQLGRKPYEVNNSAQQLKTTEVDGLIMKYSLQDKFGTLCHEILEHIMKYGNANDVTCTLCENSSDNEKLLKTAHSFAKGFLDSSFYKDKIENHKTEQELRFYTTADEKGEVALEGVIDLLVFGEKENLVVDYKTDTIKDPDVHKAQVLSYIKVAEDIFKKPCQGILFYLRDSSTGPIWNSDGSTEEL